MNCPKCSAMVPEGYKFCVNCGAPMGSTQPVPPQGAQAAAPTPPGYPPPQGYPQGDPSQAYPPSYPQGYPPPQGYPQGDPSQAYPPGYPPPQQPGYPPPQQSGYPPQGASPQPQGQGGYPPQPPGGIRIDADGRGSGRGYNYEILHQPAFSLAVVQLQAEQSILAEAGAMEPVEVDEPG